MHLAQPFGYLLRLVDLDFADMRPLSSAMLTHLHAQAFRLSLSSHIWGLETQDRSFLKCKVFPVVRIDWLKLPRSHTPWQRQLFITPGSHDWGFRLPQSCHYCPKQRHFSDLWAQRLHLFLWRWLSVHSHVCITPVFHIFCGICWWKVNDHVCCVCRHANFKIF